MKLFYYDRNDCSTSNDKPIIYVKNNKDETLVFESSQHQILFVLQGTLEFLSGGMPKDDIVYNCMVLLPSNNRYYVYAKEDVSAILFNIDNEVIFHNNNLLESLYDPNTKFVKSKFGKIEVKERLIEYLSLLLSNMQDGLREHCYFQIKQEELFVLLRYYYTIEELSIFFKPILSKDIKFSNMIYKNYDQDSSIESLAKALNYSVSGFKKRFKKVFGMSISQWMDMEKAKKVYNDIMNGRNTFKEISNEYGFSSPSHFNKFCKKFFGASPTGMRKELKK
jgi:AraC-like DNA-binding protein